MNTYELNSARNCLRVLINSYNIKEIFLPYYICPDVWIACRKENCTVKFYHIDDNFMPVFDFKKSDYVLYPNYFGICAKNVIKLAEKFPNLIVDNAHAYYMKHIGLASFNSYRKFFEVSDGAKLYTSCNINLDKDNYFYENTPKNFDEFIKNERRISELNPMHISDCTKNRMQNTDFEKEKEKRLQSFYEFDKKYRSTNQLKINLSEYDVPFVYPYLSDIQINIPSFRYWSPLSKTFLEYKFYKYLKPIPLINIPYLNE